MSGGLGILERLEEPSDVDRFLEDRGDAGSLDSPGIFVGRDSGEGENRKRYPSFALGEKSKPLGAVPVRQRDVENQHVRWPALDLLFGFRERARFRDFVARRLEEALQAIAREGVVLDDQDPPALPALAGRRRLGRDECRRLLEQLLELRQRERDAGSLAFAAVEEEIASHELHELLGDRQSETGPARSLSVPGADLAERLEDGRHEVGRNAVARV